MQPTCRGLIAASLCSLETLTSSQCKEGGGFTRSAGTMDSLVVSWELEPTQRSIRKRLRQKLGRSQRPTHMNLVGRSGPARARPTSLFGRGHTRCNLRRQEIRSCGPSRLAAYTNAPRRSHKLWSVEPPFWFPVFGRVCFTQRAVTIPTSPTTPHPP